MLQAMVFLAIIFCHFNSMAGSAGSFQVSKKIAAEIFNQNPVTLYCGCRYDKNNRIDLSSCNMSSASGKKRSHKMEWEHMMPAENIGRQYRCWREHICRRADGKMFRGRKCCQKTDAKYRQAEGELYNLWPSVGMINGKRSNYRAAIVEDKRAVFGCNISIDSQARKMEPPDRAKGILARASLFMADYHHVKLGKSQRQLFMTWNRQFPPDEWEKIWAKQVEKVECYPNPWIQEWSLLTGTHNIS